MSGNSGRQSRLTIPWCTYCSPEVAHIGMNVKEAGERGISVKSYTVMMQDVDRAITDGQDEGFLKVYVREGSDTIIGATRSGWQPRHTSPASRSPAAVGRS